MKTILYDVTGKKKRDIELPKIFETKIREDVVAKCFEAEKIKQLYAPYEEAGKRHSAAGTISHQRHRWGGHYGKGISRTPRKTMWRRGTQFYWIGAEVSGTRGGRRAHPPRLNRAVKIINQKEMKLAFDSAFAATGNEDFILKRYGRLNKIELKMPSVIESKLDNAKAKDLIKMLKNIYGEMFELLMKKKEVRSGKGKIRNRKYKSNAGLLLVKSKDEKIKMKGIEVKNMEDVDLADLYPLGRITVYTEKAIGEISK